MNDYSEFDEFFPGYAFDAKPEDRPWLDSETLLQDLRESIKKETIRDVEAELKYLREENEKLSEFRDKYAQYQRDLRKLQSDMDNQEKMIYEECRRKRLEELLVSEVGYTIKRISERGDKCDQCDNDRKRHFKSPLGRDMKEDCSCAAYHVRYEVAEARLYRFMLKESDGVIPRYYFKDHDEYWECNQLVSVSDADDGYIYLYDHPDDEKKFEDLSYYRAFFFYKSVAEEYAAFLNAKEGN